MVDTRLIEVPRVFFAYLVTRFPQEVNVNCVHHARRKSSYPSQVVKMHKQVIKIITFSAKIAVRHSRVRMYLYLNDGGERQKNQKKKKKKNKKKI